MSLLLALCLPSSPHLSSHDQIIARGKCPWLDDLLIKTTFPLDLAINVIFKDGMACLYSFGLDMHVSHSDSGFSLYHMLINLNYDCGGSSQYYEL